MSTGMDILVTRNQYVAMLGKDLAGAGFCLQAGEEFEIGPGEVKTVSSGVVCDMGPAWSILSPMFGLVTALKDPALLQGLIVIPNLVEWGERGVVDVTLMNMTSSRFRVPRGHDLARVSWIKEQTVTMVEYAVHKEKKPVKQLITKFEKLPAEVPFVTKKIENDPEPSMSSLDKEMKRVEDEIDSTPMLGEKAAVDEGESLPTD